MKKIALILFCVAVVLGLIYTFGQPEVKDKSQKYFENIQATKEYECTLRREKGGILDGFTYPESISYSKGDITTERINEIDAILKAGISDIEDCTGVNYHGVSYIPKVYADEPSMEGIKAEIKKNSNTWDRLEVKRVAIVRNQTGLNEVNNNLRNQLPKQNNSVIDTIKNTKLRDTDRTCKVDGKEVSLGAVVYGFVKQEGGYREGTPGYESNNRGSLRVNHGVVPISGTRSEDNTSNRLEYYNVQDGLYHLSYVVVEKGYDCNIGRRSIFCYVYGCGGKHTATRDAETTQRYNTFKKNAFSY